MSLRKLKNPTPQKVVKVSDDEGFVVRGLSPADVMGLYYRHTGELSNLFEKLAENYQANGNQIAASDVQTVAFSMMREAPQILAEVIALAAGGDPMSDEWSEEVDIAKLLPFPVQADAVSKIGELSFTSEMPAGKFVSLIVGAVKSMMSRSSPEA